MAAHQTVAILPLIQKIKDLQKQKMGPASLLTEHLGNPTIITNHVIKIFLHVGGFL